MTAASWTHFQQISLDVLINVLMSPYQKSLSFSRCRCLQVQLPYQLRNPHQKLDCILINFASLINYNPYHAANPHQEPL